MFIFPPCCPDFDLYSLKWWSVIDVFAFAEKLRVPITHPLTLIAQSLFGLAQIRPEYTSSRIQLNCLYTHGALALVCLDWLWHDGEFHPQPPSPSLPLLYLTDNPTVVLWGRSLSVKGEGWIGPGATNVALRKGQRREDASGLEESLAQMNLHNHRSKFRHKVYCVSPP